MIDAILNIPKENLLINEDRVLTKEKSKIIIVFLDKDYKIIDADKKTYDEWKDDNRISQEGMKLLDCEKFIGSGDIRPSRKGFGGQFGMSTCSPVHFKLTKTYLETIKKYWELKKIGKYTNEIKGKTIEKKIETFIKNGKSGLLDKEYFNEIKDKIIPEIKKIFLVDIKEKDGKILLKWNDIIINDRDYLLIKIPDGDIPYLLKEHQRVLEDIRKGISKNVKAKTKCFICKKDLNEGFIVSEGNFEGNQKKHNQIFHKFYQKINSQPNILVCNDCNNKLSSFFTKIRGKKYIPIPLNLRDKENFDYNDIFSDETILRKLKKVYGTNKNNPFDYVLITSIDSNNYIFEYIPNFNYILTTNNEILETKFNEITNKKKEIDELVHNSHEFTKGNFINHLDQIYLNRKLIVYKLFSKQDKLEGEGSFIKLIFLEYKEKIINLIFKENYWFQREGLARLVHKILKNMCKIKMLKDYFSTNRLQAKKLLIYYFLYSKSGGIKMDIENIKQIEEMDVEELKIDNDFKAAYFIGQIAYYTISQSNSSKNVLELLGTYLISINNMDSLKKKLCELSLRFKHKIIPTKRWKKINEEVLKFHFTKQKLDDNLIPFFTGFYADNIFYKKKSEED